MLYAAHGNKSAMCWDKVAALADLCDDLRNDPEVLPASDAALEKDARNEESGLEQTAAMLRATLARQPTGARVRDGS
jgi:hypothetical protein